MTKSMTGYGRSQQNINGRTISVELKSVNHRYFEFSSRTPRGCSFMEEGLKALVAQKVSRGKIDLYLNVTNDTAPDMDVRANITLAKSYLAALDELSRETGLVNQVNLAQLSRYPDIFAVERMTVDEEQFWQDVSIVANDAVDNFTEMRRAEGEKLEEDLLIKLDIIKELTTQVEAASPETVNAYRNRLYAKIQEVLGDRNIDEGRLLTEVAIFSEKVSVDEETVRLKSHIEQFKTILKETVPVGRKLDFLTQELNREANTIGSKSQNSGIARVVIDLKSEIEKIREQIQNIE